MANKNTQVIEVVTRGADKSKQQLRGVSGGLAQLAKQAAVAAGAYFGARALLDGVRQSIDLFAQQELAEKKLRFAAGASTEQLIKQAKALQSVTIFGDEAIIAQQAYVKSLGISTEQTEEIIAASVDLASAMGISLESAVMNTTKTLSGMQGELGEKLPAAFKELTAEQLKAGEGIKFIREQFRGTANEEAKTLTGQLEQMKNASGDAAEALGETLAPMAVKIAGAMKSAAETFQSFFQEANESSLETVIRETRALGGNTTDLEVALNKVKTNEAMAKLGGDMRDVSDIEKDITQQQNQRLEFNKFQVAHMLKMQDFIDGEHDVYGNILTIEQLRKETADGSRALYKGANQEQLEFFFQEFDHNESVLNQFDEKIEKLKEEQANTTEINRLEIEKEAILAKQKATEENLLKVKNDSNKSTDDKIKKESKLSKLRKEKNREAALTEINSAMASAKGNLINQIMKAVPFPLNLLVAKGASDRIDKLFNKINVKTAQYGADFVTDGPQMMMVGEGSGPERVQVTPLVDPNIDGPQGQGVTLNISGNVLHDSFVEDSVVPQIREALRMGENLGA